MMSPLRISVIVAGLALFSASAVLDVFMVKAAGSIYPLAVLALLVPAPLVFFLLVAGPPRRQLFRSLAPLYLGLCVLGTGLALLGVSWVGSERAIHPEQCESMPQLAAYPHLQSEVEDVRFASRDGTRLAGWFIPGERSSTVLLLHGRGCTRNEMLPHADMLHQAGYNLFLFDFRSRGESEGEAVTLGYRERGDVLGAIDYLNTRSDVDKKEFGLLGVSQGGATAILAAAETHDVKAIASEASFRSLDSVVQQSFEHFIGLPAFPFAPLTVWLAERRLGIKSEQIAPEFSVRNISPRPILVMHGTRDQVVNPEDAKAIYAAAGGSKELWLIPGAGHADGVKKASLEYRQRIVSFFDSTLR